MRPRPTARSGGWRLADLSAVAERSEAKAECRLICVPPQMCEQVWPLVRHLIARAYQQADEPMPDMAEEFRSAHRLLWLAARDNDILAAATTSLLQLPSGLACKLIACGGDGLEEWRHLLDRIERYARAEGCVQMRIEGRRGWARILRDYQVKSVVLTKRLSDGER
jgi:hypothetical protein